MIGKILLVDDEEDMLALLKRIITQSADYEVVAESNPENALSVVRNNHLDLMITDLKMPRINGLQLLEEVKKISPHLPVIILTGFATIETAVDAIRKGAYDYITKPFRRERILELIDKVMKWRQMVRENEGIEQAVDDKNGLSSLLGTTAVMREIFGRIKQAAPTNGTVLINGASGTGKELVARVIHQYSLRRYKKMVTINCTTIPEQLMESELFGHVKGAFTGAWQDKKGLVAEADGGTLFLDEIAELNTSMQTRLLRLIQEGEYRPVGGVKTHKADLRIIAATNRDLKTAIREKRFREDLYYRLNVIRFDMPLLKERKDDIPALSYHFLKKYARQHNKSISSIAPSAMQALMNSDFQGNVRELENTIERGVIYCATDTLRESDFLLNSEIEALGAYLDMETSPLSFKETKDRVMQMFHRQYVEAMLRQSNGNVSRAAEMAGIKRQYFHRLMKECGVDPDQFKGRKE